jgi:hypothetical protein
MPSFIQSVIGPRKTVGIVCARKRFLSDDHLENVGIDLDSRLIVAGFQDEYGCPEFDNLRHHEKRPDTPALAYPRHFFDLPSQSPDGRHGCIGPVGRVEADESSGSGHRWKKDGRG